MHEPLLNLGINRVIGAVLVEGFGIEGVVDARVPEPLQRKAAARADGLLGGVATMRAVEVLDVHGCYGIDVGDGLLGGGHGWATERSDMAGRLFM